MKNIIGKRFGRLVVKSSSDLRHKRDPYAPYILCECDCGTKTVKRLYDVVSGRTKSCGCLRKEGRRPVHGKRYTPEYGIWCRIKQRCYNPKTTDYAYYSKRGIKVSDEWITSFETFYQDMGPRPSKNHSIERIDNNKDYQASNCKWIEKPLQARNTRKNRYLTYEGQTLTMSEWNRKLNLPPGLLEQRINRLKWSIKKAISTPLQNPFGNP